MPTSRPARSREATRAAIRRTGCAVVRGVFPEAQANDWFAEVGRYIDDNDYEEQARWRSAASTSISPR